MERAARDYIPDLAAVTLSLRSPSLLVVLVEESLSEPHAPTCLPASWPRKTQTRRMNFYERSNPRSLMNLQLWFQAVSVLGYSALSRTQCYVACMLSIKRREYLVTEHEKGSRSFVPTAVSMWHSSEERLPHLLGPPLIVPTKASFSLPRQRKIHFLCATCIYYLLGQSLRL